MGRNRPSVVGRNDRRECAVVSVVVIAVNRTDNRARRHLMRVTLDPSDAAEREWGLLINLGGPATDGCTDLNVAAAWVEDGRPFLSVYHGSRSLTWCDDFSAEMGKQHAERARILQARYGILDTVVMLITDAPFDSDYVRAWYATLQHLASYSIGIPEEAPCVKLAVPTQ